MGFLLVAFVKYYMNTYTTLHDLSLLTFFLLMNVQLIITRVEGILPISFGIVYGVINTWLMMITWLERFTGNANFLFFQIIVLDAFVIFVFVQVFMAVDAKRKKYAKELLPEENVKGDVV